MVLPFDPSALDASDGRMGARYPRNVVGREEEPDVQAVYHVSIVRIGRLAGIAPDDEETAEIMVEAAFEAR